MYPIVPLGGAAFNPMQFSKEELLANSQYMNGFRLSTEQQYFQSCDLMYTYYYLSMW